MNSETEKTCAALDELATKKTGVAYSITTLHCLTKEQKSVFFSFLQFFGVIKIDPEKNTFTIPAESALLFTKSVSAFLKQGNPLISVWNNRDHSDKIVNEKNVFISSNFLSLVEKARKEACPEDYTFEPIYEGTTVRGVICRRSWWRKLYLVQYSEQVGSYQLVGGLVKDGDPDEKVALLRKIREEIPIFGEKVTSQLLQKTFESQSPDEEIIFSNKFGVYARYKTYIYSVGFTSEITKNELKDVTKDKRNINRWVSIKEIKKGTAKDKKPIFKITSKAIDNIKKANPNITVKQYNLGELIDATWLRVTLAIGGLAGFAKLIYSLIPSIQSLFNPGP